MLGELADRIRGINTANGWRITQPGDWSATEYKVPTILALIHSEVSEALEAFRHDDHANFAEEMADILIRVLDACPGLGVDIDAEVEKKLIKNAARGFKHGGKKV
jgi:NTP pyrophosphatase (non-canonical NTP hydrolase)